jgi:uncharacterized protein
LSASVNGNNISETFCVITGASQGFGKYLALASARRNINTILVSLPGENIRKVAEQCEKSGTKSYVYETDLSKKENVLKFSRYVNQNFKISMLINNAGCGGSRHFLHSDIDYIDQIIQTNITATTLLTHQLLPNLLQQDQAYILNVSSLASFSPLAYKTVYPASKKFIQHFTTALTEELKDSHVSISVVYPGPMKTNGDVTRRIESQNLLSKIGVMEAAKAAEITIRELLRKNHKIVPGVVNYFSWLILSVTPKAIKVALLSKAARRECNANFHVSESVRIP